MGSRESVRDIGKNLERWVDGIMIRTFGHNIILELAENTRLPVINALTDLLHPCQALADFFTLLEKKGSLAGLKLAYVGDGNNVAHSLMLAAAKAGMKMAVATPPGYEPKEEIINWAKEDGRGSDFELTITHDPAEAVRELMPFILMSGPQWARKQKKKPERRFLLHIRLTGNYFPELSPELILCTACRPTGEKK